MDSTILILKMKRYVRGTTAHIFYLKQTQVEELFLFKMANRGDAFIADAEKIMKRTTIFGFGKSQKYEEGAEAFTKAGNAFKITKEWQKAGNAFIRAAECYAQTESPNDVCNSYVEAGNSFKNVRMSEFFFNIMLPLSYDMYL